ncbi:hypothetical protein NXY31_08025 [Bacteroides salyersiae]|nr:hypothetical protein [Bacteroides salyersiae]
MSKKFTLKARNITDRKNRALNPDVINKKQYQHSQNKTFLFKHKKRQKEDHPTEIGKGTDQKFFFYPI